MNCIIFRRFIVILLPLVALQLSNKTLAQTASGAVQARYRSDVDEMLSINKVSVLPFTDNLQGIYSRHLETYFIDQINGMHRWDFVPASGSGPVLTPEELEMSPEKARQAAEGLGVDAFFSGRLSKGPNGVTIHLSLFLSEDGKLLSQAILKDYKQFQISDLQSQMQKMLNEIIARLPYSGRILSRDGNRITVNVGKKDGIQENQILSVVQIIQIQRHPKFNFLIKTEKEVLGKVKLLKIDDTLSFGVIVTERERDTIQKGSKVGALDFVTYGAAQQLSLNSEPEEALSQREDGAIAFGKDAHAWRPERPASFGQIGGRFGLGSFSGNSNISTDPLEAKNSIAPHIQLDGEIWVTPELTFAGRLRQGVIPISNPREGSSPSELNQSLNYYEASLGYRLRLGPHVWSAYFEPYLGYFNYKLYVDDASPQVFTTMQYSGAKIGVRGSAPLGGEKGLYGFGGEFAFGFKPSLKETPVTSGESSENSMTQFGIFGFRKISERMKVIAQLDFEMYASNFSGNGTRTESATSASHRYTTLSGGIFYMF